MENKNYNPKDRLTRDSQRLLETIKYKFTQYQTGSIDIEDTLLELWAMTDSVIEDILDVE